jgi:CubicO group peptidase (beta-lactamase class C family)
LQSENPTERAKKMTFKLYTCFSFLIALPLAFVCSDTKAEVITPGQIKEIDSIFADWDRTDTPGCALSVMRDSRIIYKRAYGMANLEG